MFNMIRPVTVNTPRRFFADDLFRSFFEMANAPQYRSGVREVENGYLFEAELPGFEPSEIDLSVKDGAMTITAKHTEGDEHAYGSHYTLERTFSLDGVDEEQISAEYRNGVLRVHLPRAKAEETAPRKIELH